MKPYTIIYSERTTLLGRFLLWGVKEKDMEILHRSLSGIGGFIHSLFGYFYFIYVAFTCVLTLYVSTNA